MIDTIKIVLRRIDAQRYWDINRIAENLDPGTVYKGTRGNKIFISGSIKNMKVKINNDYLTVTGSLPKYYFGNNLQTLDIDDTNIVIAWLADDLKMPIERGYIKRIDIGRNIIVKKTVKKYLDCFDETNGYYRDRIKDRLLYKKPNRKYSVTFYDKIKELKKNDKQLYQYNRDGFLKGKNILRFEVKLEQEINKLLNYKAVRVVHLRSPTFLNKLNNFWYMKYKSILTKKSFTFSNDINNYGDFKKELLTKAIENIGLAKLFEMLEGLRKEGKFTSNQKSYAKEDIKRLVNGTSSLIELDHTVELMNQMDFLYENIDEDVFTHLEKILIKKEI